MHLILMFRSRQGEARSFGIDMNAFLINFFTEIWKRFDELVFGSIYWIFLLKKCINIVFLRLRRCVFLNVDRVLEDFRIVHWAPSDEASMIGERRELILFDISMNSLLDVKVFAHLLYNLNKTINQSIIYCI